MLNQELLHQEYGFLDDRIHLNACSIGLPPRRVQSACQNFFDGYLDLVYGNAPGYSACRAETRNKVAQLLGCEAHEIAFTSSTTEAICVLANGFPLSGKDNVVVCDLENPAGMLPWIGAAGNRGFSLRVAKTKDGRVCLEDLAELVDRNTRILCISAVQYGTGFLADLRTLGEFCHKRNIVFSVDAIQAIGRLNVDVKALGIDYLACGGFKGLAAGFGIGFIYCSDRIVQQMTPAYIGANGVVETPFAPETFTSNPTISLCADARRLETGSHNTLGIVLLNASLSVVLDLGIDAIQAHVFDLESRLRNGIADTSLQFPGPIRFENRSGIVVAYYPPKLYEKVQHILEKRKIIMTHRAGYMRLCFHCYNTPEQVDTIISAMREISDTI